MKIKGKGSLRQVRPGAWIGRFNIGPDPDRPGKYLYTPSRTFHCEAEWEARAALEKYRAELESNGLPDKDREHLHAYLSYWLTLREGSYKSPRTEEREKLDVRHIMELFPNVKISKLTPLFIRETYDKARESGKFDKEIYQINKRLRQVLDSAIEDGVISRNSAKRVTVPKPDPEPKDYLDHDRLVSFNRMINEQPLSGQIIGIHILLRTGMRPAEMYGLSWSDVDLASSRISINKQYSNDLKLRKPKTKSSASWIAIDGDLWYILFKWKAEQEVYLRELVGKKQTPETPVASNAIGGRIEPTNFGRFFRNLCVDTGFGRFETITRTFTKDGVTHYRGKGYKGLCPNMFRDIMATTLSGELGVDPNTLKTRMRHSDASISLNYYAHPVENSEYDAANLFSSYLEK